MRNEAPSDSNNLCHDVRGERPPHWKPWATSSESTRAKRSSRATARRWTAPFTRRSRPPLARTAT
jgi:hypothetical protein